MRDLGGRAALTLVPATAEATRPSRWFCGHCGEQPADARTPAPHARVCRACDFGLLLEAREEIAPDPATPFLIVDGRLAVRALSAAAEELLAVVEGDVVQRPVTELLSVADVDAQAASARALATAVHEATAADEPRRLTVRPCNLFGVRLHARIGVCGPPRAALMVLEDPYC